ncbi:hypothetical protein QOZ80_6AG0526140 [Eleusine coracana subsp. coracana]|nr:hypothetical protein QOZ80_6AG0526140 [Eleusine coracana subsp. coracana]
MMQGAIALLWFSLLCLCSHAWMPQGSSSSINATADELALLNFKSMLSSPSDGLLASWNTTSHFCSWAGVSCSRRHPERVISLLMNSFNLSGRISPFLGNLSFLRELDLGGNQLVGEIPADLARLIRLQALNLSFNQLQVKSFIAECEALRNMRHRNLVKVVTACASIDDRGNDFKAIVYEFMPNGSLEGWLHPDINEQSEHSPMPVIHCDLKSSNVLLDADMVAHVGDFGLAKVIVEGSPIVQQSTSSMGFRGTIGYAAPEYGAGNVVSTNGDIYSYGILVLEIVTGRRPTDSTLGQGWSLREYVELALHNRTMMDVIDTRMSLCLKDEVEDVGEEGGPLHETKMNCLIAILRLGLSCSDEMPSSRMSTSDIIKELLAIQGSLLNL